MKMAIGALLCFALGFLCCLVSSFPFIDELYEGSSCPLEDGTLGICKKLPDCAMRLSEVQTGRRSSDSFGRCGFADFTEIVCCPLNISDKIGSRPADIACQQYYNEVTSEGVVFHILGGEATAPGEFPYVAALGYLKTEEETEEETEGVIKYSCGGTLISSQHVLTAAHCVSNINDQVPIEVRLGSEDLKSSDPMPQRIPISDIIPHPRYKRSVNYNDIAIVKLKRPARLTNTVKPICLQTKPLSNNEVSTNASLVVTGWGASSAYGEGSTKLLKAAGLRLVERDSCSRLYTEFRRLPRGLDDGMICALDANTTRRADACQGDSGGPLLVLSQSSQTVVGVTSFGQACGGPSPGVYTSVYSYLDWIEAQVWPDQTSD